MSYRDFAQIEENKRLSIYSIISGYAVYIHGELSKIDHYFGLLQLLHSNPNNLAEGNIFIYIDSPGGKSSIGNQIANAIKKSTYNVTCIVSGECGSAATFIALSGKCLIMEPSTCMYFHNYTKGVEPCYGRSLQDYVKNIDKIHESIFNNIYLPFLTEREVKLLLNDQEIYIHADDASLKERLYRNFNPL
jgi:ATP-dependent protease ClpP protease subunit